MTCLTAVNWSSLVNWGRLVSWGWGVGRGSLVRSSLWVGSSSFIGHLGYITSVRVSAVLHMLDPAVRQSYRVGANHHTSLVLALHLVEL